ncbi:hypothetical protein HAX54_026778 [Datura stramonium]|uniref:EF-hand domain-containing protein n=1 Tax=Datura stramonium TaxID=4076 RepID=A0ABS8V1U5_DATST|nr:hypothetical protein [Datura stramonium]
MFTQSEAFYLAGGVQESGRRIGLRKQSTQRFQNIFRAFDTIDGRGAIIPKEIVRRMQEEQSERGIIVNVREGMSIIRPDEEEEEEFEEQQGRPGQQWWEEVIGNGLKKHLHNENPHQHKKPKTG